MSTIHAYYLRDDVRHAREALGLAIGSTDAIAKQDYLAEAAEHLGHVTGGQGTPAGPLEAAVLFLCEKIEGALRALICEGTRTINETQRLERLYGQIDAACTLLWAPQK